MPVRIQLHPDPAYVEVVYSGPLQVGEIAASARDAPEIARRYGTNLRLGDLTALVGTLSLVDLYELAAELASDPGGHLLRDAIIVPDLPWLEESLGFWETACANRGLTVRTFRDRESALKWLLQAEKPAP